MGTDSTSSSSQQQQSLNAELESFVLLGKTAKGAAAVSLVERALESSNVYVFGELLDSPNIQSLKNSNEHLKTFKLLELFAYGVFEDYNPSIYPPLSPKMLKKLKLLTIVTLASKSKILKYSDLLSALALQTIREVEDLIIEGSNVGILKGKLDQSNGHFEVDFAQGRDIKDEDISSIIGILKSWCSSCEEMLVCLEHQDKKANEAKSANIKHKKDILKEVNKVSEKLNQR